MFKNPLVSPFCFGILNIMVTYGGRKGSVQQITESYELVLFLKKGVIYLISLSLSTQTTNLWHILSEKLS